MKQSYTEKAKQLRRERRASGICRCGRPAREGKAMCEACGKKQSQAVSASYRKHRQKGLCACGRPPESGLKKCGGCRERNILASRKRAANGICAHCGSRPQEPGKKACSVCLAAVRDRGMILRASYRKAVMDNYGGKCACCGETQDEFLTIDHVNNDGKEHRKVVHASKLYRWLMKSGYPDGFQILCWNCNVAKQLHGGCPHQRVTRS